MSNFNRVFAVSVDAGRFALLQKTEFEQTLRSTEKDLYIFNGSKKLDHWLPVEVDWLDSPDEKLEQPDIAGWGATCFAIPADSYELFVQNFGGACEFLALDLQGEPWFALNILGQQDAIDRELTEFNMRNGRPSRVRRFKKLVLNKLQISSGALFRVKDAGLVSFCTDEPGGLYDLVQRFSLSGLKFTEVTLS
ncbi:hypothetical protein F9L16_23180 [Agarivorans sp. B2Z047]|uniref:hypothetical protein n=1 Tax=Agarivorans sp. B2Z047 TaxID=2652721 RepID=UPI00128BAD47|nr:hypothetical protein [Agarivorans sp. B2Z047]MPW31863.1 hypothetical protein [Agarivorans sp. B2Z047]UQN43709.1 hypothetical protein LQZ07_04355 [Agarivorans sp. B2Z047]